MPNLFRERFKEPGRGCGAAGGCETAQGAFIAAASAPARPWPRSKVDTDPSHGRFAA